MELSVSSETTFFNTKLQLKICPQLRTGSSAEDTGRIDNRSILFLEDPDTQSHTVDNLNTVGFVVFLFNLAFCQISADR